MTPIIIPVVVNESDQTTHEQQLLRTSLDYSNETVVQKAFRDGAHWENSGASVLKMTIFIVLFSIVLVQGLTLLLGLFEGASVYPEPMKAKWKYVFPLYNVGYHFSKWMSK